MQKKPFTFDDAMKFKDLRQPKISEDGSWVSYTSNPDRGDGECVIQSTLDSSKTSVPRGFRQCIFKRQQMGCDVCIPQSIGNSKC